MALIFNEEETKKIQEKQLLNSQNEAKQSSDVDNRLSYESSSAQKFYESAKKAKSDWNASFFDKPVQDNLNSIVGSDTYNDLVRIDNMLTFIQKEMGDDHIVGGRPVTEVKSLLHSHGDTLNPMAVNRLNNIITSAYNKARDHRNIFEEAGSYLSTGFSNMIDAHTANVLYAQYANASTEEEREAARAKLISFSKDTQDRSVLNPRSFDSYDNVSGFADNIGYMLQEAFTLAPQIITTTTLNAIPYVGTAASVGVLGSQMTGESILRQVSDGLDPNFWVALGEGAADTALERLTFGGGGKFAKIFKRAIPSASAKRAGKQALRHNFTVSGIKGFGKGIAGEVTTEEAQYLTDLAARKVQTGDWLAEGQTWSDVGAEMKEIGIATAFGVMPTQAAGSAVNERRYARELKKANMRLADQPIMQNVASYAAAGGFSSLSDDDRIRLNNALTYQNTLAAAENALANFDLYAKRLDVATPEAKEKIRKSLEQDRDGAKASLELVLNESNQAVKDIFSAYTSNYDYDNINGVSPDGFKASNNFSWEGILNNFKPVNNVEGNQNIGVATDPQTGIRVILYKAASKTTDGSYNPDFSVIEEGDVVEILPPEDGILPANYKNTFDSNDYMLDYGGFDVEQMLDGITESAQKLNRYNEYRKQSLSNKAEEIADLVKGYNHNAEVRVVTSVNDLNNDIDADERLGNQRNDAKYVLAGILENNPTAAGFTVNQDTVSRLIEQELPGDLLGPEGTIYVVADRVKTNLDLISVVRHEAVHSEIQKYLTTQGIEEADIKRAKDFLARFGSDYDEALARFGETGNVEPTLMDKMRVAVINYLDKHGYRKSGSKAPTMAECVSFLADIYAKNAQTQGTTTAATVGIDVMRDPTPVAQAATVGEDSSVTPVEQPTAPAMSPKDINNAFDNQCLELNSTINGMLDSLTSPTIPESAKPELVAKMQTAIQSASFLTDRQKNYLMSLVSNPSNPNVKNDVDAAFNAFILSAPPAEFARQMQQRANTTASAEETPPSSASSTPTPAPAPAPVVVPDSTPSEEYTKNIESFVDKARAITYVYEDRVDRLNDYGSEIEQSEDDGLSNLIDRMLSEKRLFSPEEIERLKHLKTVMDVISSENLRTDLQKLIKDSSTPKEQILNAAKEIQEEKTKTNNVSEETYNKYKNLINEGSNSFTKPSQIKTPQPKSAEANPTAEPPKTETTSSNVSEQNAEGKIAIAPKVTEKGRQGKKILKEYAESTDEGKRLRAAYTHNTPYSSLYKLAQDSNSRIARQAKNTLRARISNKKSAKDLGTVYIDATKGTTTKKLELASNPDIDGEILNILATDSSEEVRNALANNPKRTPSVVQILNAFGTNAVPVEGTSSESDTNKTKGKKSKGKKAKSSTPITPATDKVNRSTVKSLARSTKVEERLAAAQSTMLTYELLETLKHDPEEAIRNAANETLRKRAIADAEKKIKAGKVDANQVDVAINGTKANKIKLAKEANTDVIFDILKTDSDTDVRMAVAQNPNVSKRIIESIAKHDFDPTIQSIAKAMFDTASGKPPVNTTPTPPTTTNIEEEEEVVNLPEYEEDDEEISDIPEEDDEDEDSDIPEELPEDEDEDEGSGASEEIPEEDEEETSEELPEDEDEDVDSLPDDEEVAEESNEVVDSGFGKMNLSELAKIASTDANAAFELYGRYAQKDNKSKSLQWLKSAAKQGHEEALKILNEVSPEDAKKISPVEKRNKEETINAIADIAVSFRDYFTAVDLNEDIASRKYLSDAPFFGNKFFQKFMNAEIFRWRQVFNAEKSETGRMLSGVYPKNKEHASDRNKYLKDLDKISTDEYNNPLKPGETKRWLFDYLSRWYAWVTWINNANILSKTEHKRDNVFWNLRDSDPKPFVLPNEKELESANIEELNLWEKALRASKPTTEIASHLVESSLKDIELIKDRLSKMSSDDNKKITELKTQHVNIILGRDKWKQVILSGQVVRDVNAISEEEINNLVGKQILVVNLAKYTDAEKAFPVGNLAKIDAETKSLEKEEYGRIKKYKEILESYDDPSELTLQELLYRTLDKTRKILRTRTAKEIAIAYSKVFKNPLEECLDIASEAADLVSKKNAAKDDLANADTQAFFDSFKDKVVLAKWLEYIDKKETNINKVTSRKTFRSLLNIFKENMTAKTYEDAEEELKKTIPGGFELRNVDKILEAFQKEEENEKIKQEKQNKKRGKNSSKEKLEKNLVTANLTPGEINGLPVSIRLRDTSEYSNASKKARTEFKDTNFYKNLIKRIEVTVIPPSTYGQNESNAAKMMERYDKLSSVAKLEGQIEYMKKIYQDAQTEFKNAMESKWRGEMSNEVKTIFSRELEEYRKEINNLNEKLTFERQKVTRPSHNPHSDSVEKFEKSYLGRTNWEDYLQSFENEIKSISFDKIFEEEDLGERNKVHNEFLKELNNFLNGKSSIGKLYKACESWAKSLGWDIGSEIGNIFSDFWGDRNSSWLQIMKDNKNVLDIPKTKKSLGIDIEEFTQNMKLFKEVILADISRNNFVLRYKDLFSKALGNKSYTERSVEQNFYNKRLKESDGYNYFIYSKQRAYLNRILEESKKELAGLKTQRDNLNAIEEKTEEQLNELAELDDYISYYENQVKPVTTKIDELTLSIERVKTKTSTSPDAVQTITDSINKISKDIKKAEQDIRNAKKKLEKNQQTLDNFKKDSKRQKAKAEAEEQDKKATMQDKAFVFAGFMLKALEKEYNFNSTTANGLVQLFNGKNGEHFKDVFNEFFSLKHFINKDKDKISQVIRNILVDMDSIDEALTPDVVNIGNLPWNTKLSKDDKAVLEKAFIAELNADFESIFEAVLTDDDLNDDGIYITLDDEPAQTRVEKLVGILEKDLTSTSSQSKNKFNKSEAKVNKAISEASDTIQSNEKKLEALKADLAIKKESLEKEQLVLKQNKTFDSYMEKAIKDDNVLPYNLKLAYDSLKGAVAFRDVYTAHNIEKVQQSLPLKSNFKNLVSFRDVNTALSDDLYRFMRKVDLAAIRERLDIEQPEKLARRDYYAEAREVYSADPDAGVKLIQKILAKPEETITGVEKYILGIEMQKADAYALHTQKALDELPETATEEEKQKVKEEFSQARNYVRMVAEASDYASTVVGRLLRSFRGDEWSPSAIAKEIHAKTGTPLTDEEYQAIMVICKAYAANAEALENLIAGFEGEISEEEFKKIIAAFKDKVLRKRGGSAKTNADSAAKIEKLIDKAKDTLKENPDLRIFDVINLRTLINAVAEIVVSRDKSDSIDTQLNTILGMVNGYLSSFGEKISMIEMQKIWRDYVPKQQKELSPEDRRLKELRGVSLLDVKINDVEESKIPPLRSTVSSRELSLEERERRAKLNTKMKESDVVAPEGEKDIRLKTPLDRVKNRIRNQIEAIQRALDTNVPLERSTESKIKYDLEAEELVERYNYLRDIYNEHFPVDPSKDMEQKIKRAEARKEAYLNKLREKIEVFKRDGIILQKNKSPELHSEKIDALNLEIANTQKEFDELTESYRNEQYVLNKLKRQIAEFEKQLDSGIYLPRVKKNYEDYYNREEVQPFVKKAAELRLQRDRNKYNFEKVRWTGMEKFTHKFTDLKDTMKAIRGSLDVSSIAVQGGLLTLSNPYIIPRAVLNAVKSFWSSEKGHQFYDQIMTGPYAKIIQKSGLHIAQFSADTSKYSVMEEAYARTVRAEELLERTKVGQKIGKGIDKVSDASERAFVTPLNAIRYEAFVKICETAGGKDKLTEKDFKFIASVVNAASGHGDFFGQRGLISGLSKFLWSPARMAGQIETILLPARILIEKKNLSPGVASAVMANLIAKPLLNFAIVSGLMMMLNSLIDDDDDDITYNKDGTVEWDPRSTKFMRPRLGSRYLTITGGLEQYIVLASKIISGERKDKYGNIVKLRGEGSATNSKVTDEIIQSMLLNKLSPEISTLMGLINRKEPFGEELDTWGKMGLFAIKNSAFPLIAENLIELYSEEEIPEATMYGVLEYIGYTSNDYGQSDYAWAESDFKRACKAMDASNSRQERSQMMIECPFLTKRKQLQEVRSAITKLEKKMDTLPAEKQEAHLEKIRHLQRLFIKGMR